MVPVAVPTSVEPDFISSTTGTLVCVNEPTFLTLAMKLVEPVLAN